VALIKEIDERTCRENARRELKQYRVLARMASIKLDDIKSPMITDMPKAPSSGNHVEADMLRRIARTEDAYREIKIIDRTLELISFRSRWLLRFTYCMPEELQLWEIAERLHVDNAKVVSYLKQIALLEFAEAYPDQVLMAWK
jgi:ArpU family phage transcriptional regulator